LIKFSFSFIAFKVINMFIKHLIHTFAAAKVTNKFKK